MKHRAVTLLEVLLASSLLAMVAAACVPLLSVRTRDSQLKADASLARSLRPVDEAAMTVMRYGSHIAGEIEGEWLVVVTDGRVGVGWMPVGPSTIGGLP